MRLGSSDTNLPGVVMKTSKWFRAVGGFVLLGFGSIILAQNAPATAEITRATLVQSDISLGREGVIMRVVFPAGATSGWHTHPGEELSYVQEGELTIMIAGQAPHKYSAGQALIVPMGAVHNARNDGPKDAVLIAVYSVEKGKPLRTPAPEPAH